MGKHYASRTIELLKRISRPNPNDTILVKKPNGSYRISKSLECINTKSITEDIAKLYARKKYDYIFPDYVEDTDTISILDIGDVHIICHFRKPLFEEVVIEGGVYSFSYDDSGLVIKPMPPISSDKYIELNNKTNILFEDIDRFFDSKDLYEDLGIKTKRSALIYGPPGTGKTFSIYHSVQKQISKRDALVFFVPSYIRNMEDVFYYSEPLKGRKVIFVIEEITERAKTDTESLLNFLDGESSWEDCYIVATTNYPEELDQNIVDRPGRFDTLIYFGFPTKEEREIYFKNMLGEFSEELLEETEGFSFTYIKEIVVKSKLYGITPEEVLEENKERKRILKRNFRSSSRSLGFT